MDTTGASRQQHQRFIHMDRWRDWKESLYLAAAGMGEGPRMGPQVPAIGRLLPTLGLEETGASGVI